MTRTRSAFTESELEYLMQHNVGRIATVSAEQQPHVVPIAYEFDGRYLYFSGWNLTRSLKFRNLGNNSRLAFVVDDISEENLRKSRGIEIRGIADAFCTEDGHTYVKITPLRKISWGL